MAMDIWLKVYELRESDLTVEERIKLLGVMIKLYGVIHGKRVRVESVNRGCDLTEIIDKMAEANK